MMNFDSFLLNKYLIVMILSEYHMTFLYISVNKQLVKFSANVSYKLLKQ